MRGIVLFTIFISFQSVIFSAVIKVPGDYPTIQDAIDAAVAGDTVLVAPGTYVENIDFKGKGITVKGDQGAGVTIIDGNQAGSVVTCKSGEDEKSVLEGFTITNGSGTLVYLGYYFGGGMYNEHSNPTVTNCIFTGNSAEFGGGMLNMEHGNAKVMNCTFTGNSAWAGGGMYNGQSSPMVTNCTFADNSANDFGGGMYNSSSNPTVTN